MHDQQNNPEHLTRVKMYEARFLELNQVLAILEDYINQAPLSDKPGLFNFRDYVSSKKDEALEQFYREINRANNSKNQENN